MILSGDPQGLVLGLILFNVFTNDLGAKRSVLMKFAEDANLGSIVSTEDQNTMQEGLHDLGGFRQKPG